MLLFQSIIVYGLMIWVMTYFGNITYKCQYPKGFGGNNLFQNKKKPFITLLTKSYFLIPIFIFCFFAAVRYKVGADCEHYKLIFYDLGQYDVSLSALNLEKGFVVLAKFIHELTGSHYILLFILAFLKLRAIIPTVAFHQRRCIYEEDHLQEGVRHRDRYFYQAF